MSSNVRSRKTYEGMGKRTLARVLVAGAAVAGALAVTASPALASSNAVVYPKACSYCIGDGGYAFFEADPDGYGNPGDALKACDTISDGWGVLALLYNFEGTLIRKATTQGLTAGHCTGWKTGNLTEDKRVTVVACMIKGTTTKECWSEYAYT